MELGLQGWAIVLLFVWFMSLMLSYIAEYAGASREVQDRVAGITILLLPVFLVPLVFGWLK